MAFSFTSIINILFIILIPIMTNRKPYEVNYSSEVYNKQLYQSLFHAKVDRLKDAYLWAWVFENGTGFESNEYTVNHDGNLVSYYFLTTHPNFLNGNYEKFDLEPYQLELSAEQMIQVMCGNNTISETDNTLTGSLQYVKRLSDGFLRRKNPFLLNKCKVSDLALKFDYHKEKAMVIFKADIPCNIIPF